MKTFTSISEWLNTNPSNEQVTKVLNLINKGVIHQVRVDLWNKEVYLRKLNRSLLLLTEAKFKMPKELNDEIINTKKQIEELKKQLPPKKVIVKKVEETKK